jgi:hypothetical protein
MLAVGIVRHRQPVLNVRTSRNPDARFDAAGTDARVFRWTNAKPVRAGLQLYFGKISAF